MVGWMVGWALQRVGVLEEGAERLGEAENVGEVEGEVVETVADRAMGRGVVGRRVMVGERVTQATHS